MSAYDELPPLMSFGIALTSLGVILLFGELMLLYSDLVSVVGPMFWSSWGLALTGLVLTWIGERQRRK